MKPTDETASAAAAAMATNLRSWEQRVPVHLRSRRYRDAIALLREGRSCLEPPADAELGCVRGRTICHLQCHIGLDTLSLALLGGEVTGLDFSAAAIAAARELSRELRIPATFVEGNALEADRVLAGREFEVVFATVGVLSWIPDLRRWVRAAASLLKPGGFLYLADGHPFADLFEDAPDHPDGIAITYGYFRRAPLHFAPGPSYADDGTQTTVGETVEFLHPLGEIVTAIADAGLRIDFLHESELCAFERFRNMSRDERAPYESWRLPAGLDGKLPLTFSIRATKPAG